MLIRPVGGEEAMPRERERERERPPQFGVDRSGGSDGSAGNDRREQKTKKR
jgi:hypothetical protein